MREMKFVLVPEGLGGSPPEKKGPSPVKCTACGQITIVYVADNGKGYRPEFTPIGNEKCPDTGGDHRVGLK